MTGQSSDRTTAADPHLAALTAARAAPTDHVPRLVTSRHVRARIHGEHPVGQFNNWLGVLVTRSVGTMWAAYLFMIIGLISFPQALHSLLKGDTLTGISWLSQSFLQLVLLPVIIVGQNVISASQDARAEADHETLTALHLINVRQLSILEDQQRILAVLEKKDA